MSKERELTSNELDAVSGGAAYLDPRPAPSYVMTDAERAVGEAWSVWDAMVRANVFPLNAGGHLVPSAPAIGWSTLAWDRRGSFRRPSQRLAARV